MPSDRHYSCPRCGADVRVDFAREPDEGRWRVWCRSECTSEPIAEDKRLDSALGRAAIVDPTKTVVDALIEFGGERLEKIS